MVYDCFPFFNEHTVLDIRLNTLYDVVDKFIIVEATRSHQNLPKPLYFGENKHLYEKFLDKIIHVVVDTYPAHDYWSFEEYQRDQILTALSQIAEPEDTIFVSDADEIWNPSILDDFTLEQDMVYRWPSYICYAYFNLAGQSELWYQPFVCKYQVIKDLCIDNTFLLSKHLLRNKEGSVPAQYINLTQPLGWHFSYSEDPAYKLQNFLHSEYRGMSSEQFYSALISGKNPFHGNAIGVIEDAVFPPYVEQNKEKFSKYIIQ